jgi:integrase
VALHTGMRLGEILNLRRQDPDFGSNFILVKDSKNGDSRHAKTARICSNLRATRRASRSLPSLNTRKCGRSTSIQGFSPAAARLTRSPNMHASKRPRAHIATYVDPSPIARQLIRKARALVAVWMSFSEPMAKSRLF